ncbi:MAG: thioredoxin peroxidase, partial [Deltaproteobacteria bacterium CG_4_10_14_0_2_um_filter_43_8]
LGEMKHALAADLSKQVARDYGVLLEDAGIALRGLFIIGPDNKLHYQLVHDLGIGRNVDEVLRVLQAIQYVEKSGGAEACPVNWKPGGETLRPQ